MLIFLKVNVYTIQFEAVPTVFSNLEYICGNEKSQYLIYFRCRFRIDSNYVGEPPAIEVTIFELNDNIDKHFLTELVQKFGTIDELIIYYHPVTNKHLGIGRVVFESVKEAKACVDKLNSTRVMGKILEVFLDPFGKKCKEKYEEFTTEKKAPEVVPLPKIDLENEERIAAEFKVSFKF